MPLRMQPYHQKLVRRPAPKSRQCPLSHKAFYGYPGLNFPHPHHSAITMHRIALILMILLLPLRGWAGDLMATSMAAGQLTVLLQAAQKTSAPLAATENIATHAHETGATTHFQSKNADSDALSAPEPLAKAQTMHDCGDNMQTAADPDHENGNNIMDCGSCPSCQACHTVALSLSAEKSIAILNPAAQPDAVAQTFASADAALSQKPPIS